MARNIIVGTSGVLGSAQRPASNSLVCDQLNRTFYSFSLFQQNKDRLQELCSALHWVALNCTLLVLHYTAMHYTALYCIATHCTVLYCTELYYTSLHCTVYKSLCVSVYTVSEGRVSTQEHQINWPIITFLCKCANMCTLLTLTLHTLSTAHTLHCTHFTLHTLHAALT